MNTQCTAESMDFKCVGGRKVVAEFSGGTMTSDGGVVLLRQTEDRIGLLRRLATCFHDQRDPDQSEHSVEELVSQRVLGLALGYEDLVDHDELSRDPVLATAVGKKDPTGAQRVRQRDRGRALAGKSTLNRLELSPAEATAGARYKKIVLDFAAVEPLFVDLFLEAHEAPPSEIVLDVDATDDPLHGRQEGRFFHGFYREYCYLPLYVFCGDHLLVATLRRSNIDASAGTTDVLEWLVARIRSRWPEVRIVVRGDSGFCRDAVMAWCESHGVDYVLGLAKNARLKAALADELAQAEAQWHASGEPARVFKDFRYRTLDSWSRERRVVGKAEHLSGGSNPRFVVTSLDAQRWSARPLYEELYCARGEMENRIKEQQLYLFADRTSTKTLRANQIRLWFSSAAYILLDSLRRLGLSGTQFARARCDTIRLKLLKIGAAVRVSVRRVYIALAESYPMQRLFHHVQRRLRALASSPCPTPLQC